VSLVTELHAWVEEDYVSSTYKSCSNVIMSSTNAPAMDFLCGPWGSYRCTPHRWFDYMGSTENGFSPFDILYQYVDDSSSQTPTNIKPFNHTTLKCSQALDVSRLRTVSTHSLHPSELSISLSICLYRIRPRPVVVWTVRTRALLRRRPSLLQCPFSYWDMMDSL